MKHIFIINPAAGKKNATAMVKKMVEDYFSAHPEQGEYEILVTGAPGDATKIARKYAESGEELCFYSCGGDGTTVEVFNGILGYENCVLTSLPMGSGNDFIKAFGLDSAAAFLDLSDLVPGVVQKIDHLKTNGVASLNITTAGFDAAVCVAMNRYRRLPLMAGKGSYILAVADRFFHSLKNRYAFEVDGEPVSEDDYIFAVAANGRFYGGSFHPAPFADITDGYLDFITIPVVSRSQFLKIVGSYGKGTHFEEAPKKIHLDLTFRRAKKVRILAPEPIPVNIDGEVTMMENPTIEIVPGGVKFKLPCSVWEKYVSRRALLEEEGSKYQAK